jgi:hypothetical protein
MLFFKTSPIIAFAFAVFLCFSSAKAADVEFAFTGTGINGSVAAGRFTVAETALQPNYYANGGIYPSLSLTISNIPGGGPFEVSFNVIEINSSTFSVDANGVPSIIPLGSHGYGPPFENHYDLGAGSQPQEGTLAYNGSFRDTIVWSFPVRVVLPSPPTLAAQTSASDITLLWPTSANNFVLEETLSLASPVNWSPVTNEVTTLDQTFSVVLPFDGTSSHFFRLKWTEP